jgi:hypothetical protein
MAHRVSIPEKTLEHWASIYLANRFPHASLWWPVDGDDITVDLLRSLRGAGPGKPLVLELKTTRWNPKKGTHELRIPSQQLIRYLRPVSPFGKPLPVYYSFPVPHWNGSLSPTPSGTMPTKPGITRLDPPEWWRRSADAEWFGWWFYVMPACDVAAALPTNWRSKDDEQLFEFPRQPDNSGRYDRWPTNIRSLRSEPLLWRNFWSELSRCGPESAWRWRVVSEGSRPNDERRLTIAGPFETYETRRLDLAEVNQAPALVDSDNDDDDGRDVDHPVVIYIPEGYLRDPDRRV